MKLLIKIQANKNEQRIQTVFLAAQNLPWRRVHRTHTVCRYLDIETKIKIRKIYFSFIIGLTSELMLEALYVFVSESIGFKTLCNIS